MILKLNRKIHVVFPIVFYSLLSYSEAVSVWPTEAGIGQSVVVKASSQEERTVLGGEEVVMSVGGQLSDICSPLGDDYTWSCVVPKSSFWYKQNVSLRLSTARNAPLSGVTNGEVTVLPSNVEIISLLSKGTGGDATNNHIVDQLKINDNLKELIKNKMKSLGELNIYTDDHIDRVIENFNNNLSKESKFEIYEPEYSRFIDKNDFEKFESDAPEACLVPMVIRKSDSVISTYLHRSITTNVDPTKEPWVVQPRAVQAANPVYKTEDEMVAENAKIHEWINFFATPNWADAVYEPPKVYIIDTYKPINNSDKPAYDPFKLILGRTASDDGTVTNEGISLKGHGRWVAAIVKNLSGLKDTQIEHIPACASDKGECKIPEIIYGLCEAAFDAFMGKRVVVNMSFGTSYPGDYLKTVVKYAIEKGVYIVASTGNSDRHATCSVATTNVLREGDRCYQFPADWSNEPDMIGHKGRLTSVAGFTVENNSYVSYYRNRKFKSGFVQTDVFAPALYYYDHYERSGTSYATAFVTGTVIAWMKNNPGLPRCTGKDDWIGGKLSNKLDYTRIVGKNCP